MRKYNVLHIITKLELGGAQQNTLYSVKNHSRQIYNVFLISGTEGILVEDAKSIKDVQVLLLPELKHEISLINDFLCLLKLIKLFKKFKIDIVHTHSSKAGILGRFAAYFAKIPVIIHTIHGFSFNDFQPVFTRKLYIFLERIAAKISHKLIAVTKVDIEKGLKAKVGNEEQYAVIHSGIDLEEFTKEYDIKEVKEELNVPLNYKVVGMIACFKPQKAPLDFIRIADKVSRQFPAVKFVLVGDGELRPEIERLIDKLVLKNTVILTGWRRDIARVLSCFDILVLTSLWEGLPRVFPQAMCASKPIVATRVDGAKEAIIDGENGYLCEPKDVNCLAEKVLYLLTKDKVAQSMGKRGFGMISSFDTKQMIVNIEKVYSELVAKKIHD